MRGWSCLVTLTVCCLLDLPEFVQSCGRTDKPRLSPIVFIPGMGGSMLKAKTTPYFNNKGCPQKHGWFYILNYWNTDDECMIDKIKLDRPDIQISTTHWGRMKSVNYAMPGLMLRFKQWLYSWVGADVAGAYAIYFTNAMTGLGYTPDEDLVAAPYDYRYAPSSHSKYFARLKLLVENTYWNNARRRVILVAHSLGGLMAHHFLLGMSPEWKRKYVHLFLPVAVPWAGSVNALNLYTTGAILDADARTRSHYRQTYRTWESAAVLLPNGRVWDKSGPFIRTDSFINSYGISTMREYFIKITNLPKYRHYARFNEHYDQSKHPGVNVTLLISYGLPTINFVSFHKAVFPSGTPKFGYGDGDESVNLRSLTAATQLYPRDGFKYNEYRVKGETHKQVLSGSGMLGIMKRINAL